MADGTGNHPNWYDSPVWAGEVIWRPDAPQFIPDDAICHLAISADYPSDPSVNAWTGLGDLELGDVTYMGIGPEVVSVKIGQAAEKEDARLSVTLVGLSDAEVRRAFYEFRGRVIVTVRLVYSTDGGNTWVEVPRLFRGLYSRPQITSNQITFEVATYREELDRGYELVWSDSNQRAEYPGDRCFEHLVPIAEGRSLSSRWPP